MGWDEKVFQAGLNAFRSLLASKSKIAPEESFKITLPEISSRLRMLASALAGRSIEVKEAETVGGTVADVLFLPASIALTADREINRKAYLYRVVYSMTLAQMKIVLPDRYRDGCGHLLMSLLAVSMICHKLRENYPGLIAVEDKLCLLEKNRISQLSEGSERFQALQELTLSLLETQELPNWTRGALLAMPRNVEELYNATDLLLISLNRLRAGRENPLVLAPLIWGLILPPTAKLKGGKSKASDAPTAKDQSLPRGAEKKGKPKESVEEVRLGEAKDDENPLAHVFEKVKTVDDYSGGKKMLDGSDELEEHFDALQELNLRQVIRTRERTDSVYKVDVVIDSGAGDFDNDVSETPSFFYDEWDFNTRQYKKNWCKLFVDTQVRRATVEQAHHYTVDVLQKNARQLRDLRRQFEELTYAKRWRTRQPDGPEIDLDAVVDRYATLKSGHSLSTFLYLSQRPRERDFATLVLLDSSLSTDSWVQNRRVMDVIKESILILGEVVEEFRDRMAIGAFYSNTRNDCRYIEVKDFEENWKRCQAKLVGLHPTGYTRIGPALRHATYLLKNVKAKKKLILLISDGKPTDYDRYEGRYGIEDIRQAIRSASSENVTIRALAVESQAKFYLPQMFGTGNFQILPNPNMLAASLAQIYSLLR